MAKRETVAVRPQPGPQEMFLASSADVVIYGGAAGGGKSYGLLMEPLRHIHNPRFGGVIFRRTYPQVTNEGGLWDTSMELYPLVRGEPRQTLLEWRFPSGATVRFAHMQYEQNKLDWQGAQIPYIAWDELTHFTEGQFWYLFSRNRSLCGVRPYIRASCNPDPDSWVASLVSWWIDQDTGFAIKERAGVVRWFVRVRGELVWADTKEALEAEYPDIPPKSLAFIPASVYDNKILLAKDPGYLANLMALPLVDRARLLEGNWKIRLEGGKLFNRGWFEIVPAAPAGGRECRFWDFAATQAKLKGSDPDYTAAVKVREVRGIWYVTDCIAAQEGPAEVDRLLTTISRQDARAAQKTGTSYMVRWEEEGGSAGVRETWRMVTMLRGLDAAGRRPDGDKITRAKALAAQAQVGNVKLVDGEWNEAWLRHMHGQPDLPHDDIMDASAGAFNELASGPEARISWL